MNQKMENLSNMKGILCIDSKMKIRYKKQNLLMKKYQSPRWLSVPAFFPANVEGCCLRA